MIDYASLPLFITNIMGIGKGNYIYFTFTDMREKGRKESVINRGGGWSIAQW
jgi:hypothetical protein